jgi:hypothetical protein
LAQMLALLESLGIEETSTPRIRELKEKANWTRTPFVRFVGRLLYSAVHQVKKLTWISLNVWTRNCCWELGWVSIFEFKLAYTHTHTHTCGEGMDEITWKMWIQLEWNIKIVQMSFVKARIIDFNDRKFLIAQFDNWKFSIIKKNVDIWQWLKLMCLDECRCGDWPKMGHIIFDNLY